MKVDGRVKKGFVILGAAVLSGCGVIGGSESNSSEDGANDETGLQSVSSLEDISLSSVFSLQLPDSVKGKGEQAATGLQAQSKSHEACMLRDQVREGYFALTGVGSMLCHFEKEEEIVFGKKINIKFQGGTDESEAADDLEDDVEMGDRPDSFQVFIDNSDSKRLRISFCEDNQLAQYIELEGAGSKDESKAKGFMIDKFSQGSESQSMSWHRVVRFDSNFSVKGRTKISVKELFEMKSQEFGDEKSRRSLQMDLAEEGVSRIFSSYAGNHQGFEHADSAVGFFNDRFGSIIFKGKIPKDEQVPDAPETFSHNSFFDAAGYIVDPKNHPETFGESGALRLEAKMVPGFLPKDFSPEKFAEDAWDCSTEMDITINPDSDDHVSCEQDWDELSEENCWNDPAFAEGEEIEITDDELSEVEDDEFFQPEE